MNGTARRAAALLTCIVLPLAVSAGAARAVPPLPHTLYGQLMLDGACAPDGTQLYVLVDNLLAVASTTVLTSQGQCGLYQVDVPGDDPGTPTRREGARPGEILSFAVTDYEGDQTATWTSGRVQWLDLNGEPRPTALILLSFEVEPQGRAMLLSWETATELSLLGFDLYRTATLQESPACLNADLIAAQMPGSPTGARYTWLDRAVQAGTTYWYWLDVVDLEGGTSRIGPVSAVMDKYRVRLPLVSQGP